MILSAGGKSPGHRKPKNGPLPALNAPMTPRCCHLTHTHTHTHTITRQAFHNCLDLGDSCCIPAVSECANVCVCVCVCVCMICCPGPVLMSPSLASGGVVTSWATGPSNTHFLFTPATSPLCRKLARRQITHTPVFWEEITQERKEGQTRRKEPSALEKLKCIKWILTHK